MKRAIICILLGLVSFVSLSAQSREKKVEDDGFVWYQLSSNGYYGAESSSGKTLIPLSKGYTFIMYTSNSIGCLYVKKDNHEGIYSKDGRELISTDRAYDSVTLYTSGYFGVKKNGCLHHRPPQKKRTTSPRSFRALSTGSFALFPIAITDIICSFSGISRSFRSISASRIPMIRVSYPAFDAASTR